MHTNAQPHVQVFCQRLHMMGCILPSEPTAASVASASLVARHGGNACLLSDGDIDAAYNACKTRLKQLHNPKSEPQVFWKTLPATPVQLLRQDRNFALSIFSHDAPPVPCPLNSLAMQHVRARICMRGGSGNKLALTGGHLSISCMMGSGVDRFCFHFISRST